MRLMYKKHTLNEAAVDAVSADIQEYLNKLHAEKRSVQRIRLTVEEILLNLLEHCGDGMTISVGIGKRFVRHLFRLRYEAAPFDPTKSSENPLTDDIMRTLGLFPAWNCRGQTNTVSLVLVERPKRNALFYIFLALIAAVLLGVIGNVIPQDVRQGVTDWVLSPAADGFLGLLNTFAGLMIFLTICSGVTSMGDSASFGRIGKSVMLRMIGFSFVFSAASASLSTLFLHLGFSASAQQVGSPLGEISKMFFDILPKNLVDPFKTGNTFHIIVIAMFIGCGLLALGERGSRIRNLIHESSALLQQTVSSVCALIPVFVFCVLLRQIWSGQIGILVSAFRLILLIFGAVILLSVLFWLFSSLRLRCPPLLLMKKVLPTFLTAFTTASSVSALPLGMETCEKKLGISSSMVSFVYPLGSVIFMPSSATYFTVIICSLAELYQVPVSLSWMIMAVFICTLIAIAMPPIPGADILCYTLLFSALGIPADALVPATAIGITIDYLNTGTNVTLMMFQIACDAKRLKCLDRETLLHE